MGAVGVDETRIVHVSRQSASMAGSIGAGERHCSSSGLSARLNRGTFLDEREEASERPSKVHCAPKLSAVVVHYNDPEHLRTCVDALCEDPAIADIVVVDNASDSDALAAVMATDGHVQVVASPVNLGFGGGANLGLAYAMEECVVFLNPDTFPEAGCMTALAEHLSKHGGVVGPVVRTGPTSSPEYGCVVDRMLLPRGMEVPAEPLYVHGCCLATTKACFAAVGGFDDRYFLFQEDVEFCWQALRQELPVAVVAGARLTHAGGAVVVGGYRRKGSFETSSRRILLRERNGWAVVIACAPGRRMVQLLAWSFVRTLAFTGVLLAYSRPIDALRLWGGLVWNVTHLRGTLERRRHAGVTRKGEQMAWNRVDRRLFMWDFVRRGERLRFVDKGCGEV